MVSHEDGGMQVFELQPSGSLHANGLVAFTISTNPFELFTQNRAVPHQSALYTVPGAWRAVHNFNRHTVYKLRIIGRQLPATYGFGHSTRWCARTMAMRAWLQRQRMFGARAPNTANIGARTDHTGSMKYQARFLSSRRAAAAQK